MFKFFKLTKVKRKKVEEPKNLLTWIKHGFSEFFGTFILCFMLAGLSMVVTKKGDILEYYMIHPVLVGFYAGFIVIGLLLVIFLRWSCDLNPAVTITRMLKGMNTFKYGIYKIIIQFLAAILTGFVIYAFGKIQNIAQVNYAIDAIASSKKSFLVSKLGADESIGLGTTWILFGEIIATTLLIFSIFSPRISNKYRDLFILLIISMAVWMGILQGSASLNPAKGLAQQIPGMFFGVQAGGAHSESSFIGGTCGMMAGTLIAPFFYVFMQGLAEKINDYLVATINFKNFKSNSMKYNSK